MAQNGVKNVPEISPTVSSVVLADIAYFYNYKERRPTALWVWRITEWVAADGTRVQLESDRPYTQALRHKCLLLPCFEFLSRGGNDHMNMSNRHEADNIVMSLTEVPEGRRANQRQQAELPRTTWIFITSQDGGFCSERRPARLSSCVLFVELISKVGCGFSLLLFPIFNRSVALELASCSSPVI